MRLLAITVGGLLMNKLGRVSMQPGYQDGNVRANCPDCEGAVTTFEVGDRHKEFGSISCERVTQIDGVKYRRIIYQLMRCAGCGRAGLAKILADAKVASGKLDWFFPNALDTAKIPACVPAGVVSEFREAELCASAQAWRSASGMLRSTLEKLLKVNGYNKGSLASKIDEAAADGVITESRKKKAHEDVRVLGNDILHDEWRAVTADEFSLAHHYVQRVIEDFYDDRSSVEAILISKNRITQT
jgi:hypothetical protein